MRKLTSSEEIFWLTAEGFFLYCESPGYATIGDQISRFYYTGVIVGCNGKRGINAYHGF